MKKSASRDRSPQISAQIDNLPSPRLPSNSGRGNAPAHARMSSAAEARSSRSRTSRSLAILGALLGLLSLALLFAAGCSHAPSLPPVKAATVAEFVSETECQACHSDISRKCAAANHALTLRVAAPSALGRLAPLAQPIPDTCYSVRAEGDRLVFATSAGKEKERTLDLALGSGKLGMTYVSLNPDNTLTEMRMSWYPHRKSWYITPGHENLADNEPGDLNDKPTARLCMGCHSVTVPSGGLRPENRFFGVGCQSCHGPASAHVAAAKAGQLSDLRIERIATWDAARINEMCGKCHRSPQRVGTSGDEVSMTQRFQPYGLMQSPCFQKSGGKLSCITCHDPHTNVSKDMHSYEKVCLSCHSVAHAPVPSTAPDTAQTKVCPVNPRDKCIGCHMPTRQVFPVSKIPIAMADHLIWAYSKKKHPLNDSHTSSLNNPSSTNMANADNIRL